MELLKNKFEEKYKIWKAYTTFIENNDEDLKMRQKDFTQRVPKLETKEHIEELFELQGEPSKHLSDHANLSNDLLVLYNLFTDKSEFPQEVKDEMEKLNVKRMYYMISDSKLVKINEELHDMMKENFYNTIQNITNFGK